MKVKSIAAAIILLFFSAIALSADDVKPPWVILRFLGGLKFNGKPIAADKAMHMHVGDKITFDCSFILEAPPGYESYRFPYVGWECGVNRVTIGKKTFWDFPLNTKMSQTFEWTVNSCGKYDLHYNFMLDDAIIPFKEGGYTSDGYVTINVIGCDGLPDLVTEVAYSPLIFVEGDKVTFSVKVKNIGTLTSKKLLLLGRVEKPDGHGTLSPFPFVRVPALSPGGESKVHNYTWDANCLSQVVIFYIENEDGLPLYESNHDNNRWFRKMVCHKPTAIDIVPRK